MSVEITSTSQVLVDGAFCTPYKFLKTILIAIVELERAFKNAFCILLVLV